jgi:hypothetical protein
LRAYFTNLESDFVVPIVARYGLRLDEIDTNQWYSLQLYYDIDKEIYQGINGSEALVAIGKATIANMLSRSSYVDLEDYLLNGLTTLAARDFIRNVPETFGFFVSKIAPNRFRLQSNLPAANETIYGAVWEACRMLKHPDQTFTLIPVEGFPGNDICATFEVQLG